VQNKRGIAQAFSSSESRLDLRRATVFDVFDMSRVLTSSIRDLCGADHRDDPHLISLWTANKDPGSIRNWIISGADLWLGECANRAVAVGGLLNGDTISLLYVDPHHVGNGVGIALLTHLEQELARGGCAKAKLNASTTAREFYLRRGWRPAGQRTEWNGIPQFPMSKSLA